MFVDRISKFLYGIGHDFLCLQTKSIFFLTPGRKNKEGRDCLCLREPSYFPLTSSNTLRVECPKRGVVGLEELEKQGEDPRRVRECSSGWLEAAVRRAEPRGRSHKEQARVEGCVCGPVLPEL